MFNKKNDKTWLYTSIALLAVSVCLNIYFVYKLNALVLPPANWGCGCAVE
ncbi:MAG: hypothetical protein ABIE43_00895 [Patescibacteria group bacterium]